MDIHFSKLTFQVLSQIEKKYSWGSIHSNGGRNMLGRICVHHKGAGNKRIYRKLDYFRRLNQKGSIMKIIKDTFRTSLIGIVLYFNGIVSQIIVAENNKIGSFIYSGTIYSIIKKLFFDIFFFKKQLKFYILNKIQGEIYYDMINDLTKSKNFKRFETTFFLFNDLRKYYGSSFPIREIPLFSRIHCVEKKPKGGFLLARAAGTFCINVAKKNKKIILKMSSGWQLIVDYNVYACFGICSNMKHKFIRIGKAGKQRSLGVRPTVRGVAKNPCDHPHGGGEGKSSPPASPVTPWGKLTKGTPTKKKLYHKEMKRMYKEIKK